MSLIKRSVMTLYSDPLDCYCHQVRIVLAEKGIGVEVFRADRNHVNEDLLKINPYGTLPTLIDRELVLYNSNVIMEYLDERFPHPPLLPVYPVARAKSRLMMYRIERDWYSLVRDIERAGPEQAQRAREELTEGLITLIPVFQEMPYFLSEVFTMVDCIIAPIFWRLPKYGVELPSQAKPIMDYMDRVFSREAFKNSLTEAEKEIRESL